MKKIMFLLGLLLLSLSSNAHLSNGFIDFSCSNGDKVMPAKSLHELQQDFIDLRFGMFIHFNMPTFQEADWPDPLAPASSFDPTRLDC
jgi:hypothetical protein